MFQFLALVAMLFSKAEPSDQFYSRGQHEDQFCEIILILTSGSGENGV